MVALTVTFRDDVTAVLVSTTYLDVAPGAMVSDAGVRTAGSLLVNVTVYPVAGAGFRNTSCILSSLVDFNEEFRALKSLIISVLAAPFLMLSSLPCPPRSSKPVVSSLPCLAVE